MDDLILIINEQMMECVSGRHKLYHISYKDYGLGKAVCFCHKMVSHH